MQAGIMLLKDDHTTFWNIKSFLISLADICVISVEGQVRELERLTKSEWMDST